MAVDRVDGERACVRSGSDAERQKQVLVLYSTRRDAQIAVVADNGIGFDVQAVRAGIGLVCMTERAEQAGATLRIQSRTGGGTHVDVSVPLRSEILEESSVI